MGKQTGQKSEKPEQAGSSKETQLFKRVSEILSICIFLSGSAVLIGWILDIPVLKSISPDFVTMKANTAICFVFIGLSLWLSQTKWQGNRTVGGIARLCAFVVFLIGFLTFWEYMLGRDFGIDQLLFKESATAILTSSPGRMSFNTSIIFVIISIALFMAESETVFFSYLAQLLVIPAGTIALLSFVGYLYGATPLYIGLKFSTAMALHTSVLFMMSCIGCLFVRPEQGLMKDISSDNYGGLVLRRILPVVIVIPLVLGWFKIHGEKTGLFGNEFGGSLVATSNLVAVSLFVYMFSVYLNRLDIKRKQAEEKLKKLNAELSTSVKEMEAFSYSVSHDLKAPLRAMAGFSKILSEDYAPKLDDNGRRVIGVINDNARNMGQLIDDLLHLSRQGRQAMDVIDIDVTTLVQSVCHELREELFRDRAIEVSVKPLLTARADHTLAKQIFTNLISNAMKFTSHKDKTLIEIGGYDNGQDCVYYVKDNGVGFDMKYADKLFGVFQRLHAQDEFSGTGIGLAIVSNAVRRHGGKVWAEAEVDKGATFYFTLPKGEIK